MQEVWKDIAGYEGLYQVSNFGRVKSLGRYTETTHRRVPEKIRTPKKQKAGYLVYELHKNGVRKFYFAHRIVAEAFCENPESKPQVNHINGNKHDNTASNLEWCTSKENHKHAYETGLCDFEHRKNRKGSIAVSQYDLNMNLIATYPSIREAARQTGVDDTSIGRGIRKGWKCGGFIWKMNK